MSRSSAMRRLLSALGHAGADTPEGRVAAGVAERLVARWGFTAAEIAEAQADRDAEGRRVVELEGWGEEPWLVVLVAMVADAAGDAAAVFGPRGARVRLALEGPGAGADARQARHLRARVDAALDRAGGPPAVAQLRLPRVAQAATTATWSGYGTWLRSPTLAALAMDEAGSADAWRLVAAARILARWKAERLSRERQESASASSGERDPVPPTPGTGGGAPPAGGASSSTAPTPPAPIEPLPPPTPGDLIGEAVVRRVFARVRQLQTITHAALRRGLVVDVVEPVPPTALVPWMGGAIKAPGRG